MPQTARAAVTCLALIVLPAAALAQVGPAEPQVIAAASTARVNLSGRKAAGYVTASVRVGTDGKVKDVQVTENTTEGLDQALVRVLQSARFRPAIDAAGKLVEGSIDMKVELRASTGAEPKPVAAKPDPQLTDREKVRIKKMRCSDFVWEWNFLRDEAGDATATEFMPRIATSMYAAMRTEAGDYVDTKVWKAAPKALRQAADACKDSPSAPFWDGIFKGFMDEAVTK